MKVVTLTPGARGIDTVLVLDTAKCLALRAEAVRFVVRYLGSITAHELQTITSAGLACSFVTYAKHWDGPAAVKHLQEIGAPVGCVVWLDVEGVTDDPQTLIARINAWARAIKDAGYIPGMYVGAGCPLTSVELYALVVSRYWHSCSRVTDRDGREAAPSCGWCLYQLSPPNVKVANVQVDIDFAQLDYQGRGVSVAIQD